MPVEIADAPSPKEAARRAIRIIENQYGIHLSGWFLRIFEYSGEHDDLDFTEYFANPAGTVFRDKDQNIELHEEMVNNNTTPEDIK